jgi:hypothetical protein
MSRFYKSMNGRFSRSVLSNCGAFVIYISLSFIFNAIHLLMKEKIHTLMIPQTSLATKFNPLTLLSSISPNVKRSVSTGLKSWITCTETNYINPQPIYLETWALLNWWNKMKLQNWQECSYAIMFIGVWQFFWMPKVFLFVDESVMLRFILVYLRTNVPLRDNLLIHLVRLHVKMLWWRIVLIPFVYSLM